MTPTDDPLERQHVGQDRLAGLGQALVVAMVITTTPARLHVWVIEGWFIIAFGVAYGLAALVSAFRAPSELGSAYTAGLGTVWWAMRCAAYIVMAYEARSIIPLGRAATQGGIGLMVALYYRRGLFRIGFFRAMDRSRRRRGPRS